jgi:isoleucyl-tRNA synthetase
VWGTRYPEGGSVHLLEWPTLPRQPVLDTGQGFSSANVAEESQAPDQVRGDELIERWGWIRSLRTSANSIIEPLRREKVIGSSLEAEVIVLAISDPERLAAASIDFNEVCITASATVVDSGNAPDSASVGQVAWATRTTHHKCGRCWRHLPEVTEDGALCSRCDQVVGGMEAAE